MSRRVVRVASFTRSRDRRSSHLHHSRKTRQIHEVGLCSALFGARPAVRVPGGGDNNEDSERYNAPRQFVTATSGAR